MVKTNLLNRIFNKKLIISGLIAFTMTLGDYAQAGNNVMTELHTNQNVYRDGDLFSFSIDAKKDGFAYCFYYDIDGNVTRLLPTEYNHNNKIKAGTSLKVPDESYKQGTLGLNTKKYPSGTVERVSCYLSKKQLNNDELMVDNLARNNDVTRIESNVRINP